MPAPPASEGNPALVEEANFANWIAGRTGLDPRVILSWAALESGGSALAHNWLNIRPYPGDPYIGVSPGGFEEFSSVSEAEQATLTRLRMPFARPIIASAGQPPATEILAIASTGWDAGHYSKTPKDRSTWGENLLSEFESLYPSGNPQGPPTKSKVTGTGGGGGSPSSGVGDPFGIVSGITGFFGGIWSWFLNHLERLGLLLAGALLVILGVLLVARGEGISTPVPAVGG